MLLLELLELTELVDDDELTLDVLLLELADEVLLLLELTDEISPPLLPELTDETLELLLLLTLDALEVLLLLELTLDVLLLLDPLDCSSSNSSEPIRQLQRLQHRI